MEPTNMNNQLPTKVKLTPAQEKHMEIVRVAAMGQAPFFAYYFYAEMEEYPTTDLPTAGTDAVRVFYNPVYVCGLSVQEGVFVLIHEIVHAIEHHPQRMKYYARTKNIKGMVYNANLFNICADFCINKDLVENNIGRINPTWLYDPSVKGDELVEVVYKKYYKPPPPPGGGGQGKADDKGQPSPGSSPNGPTVGSGQGQPLPSPTASEAGHAGRGARPDKIAEGNQGRFDELLEARDDVPSEGQFKEAIARAAQAAKAMGKLPDWIQRKVDTIMTPQTNWREHIRMTMTGRLGLRFSDYTRPNRRRLVLNPIVILPGKRGYGADTVAVVVDTSGSISKREHDAYFGEVGGILQDIRPRKIITIWCDAEVRRVEEVRHLDELMEVVVKPTPGGGGTDFRPPFEYLAEQGIRPETLVYLTDMLGPFPAKDPGYPVIWCATRDAKAPFGELVRLDV